MTWAACGNPTVGMLLYKGKECPVEPATVAKVLALFKQGVVDGLAPGLNSTRPGSTAEAPIGLIKKTNTIYDNAHVRTYVQRARQRRMYKIRAKARRSL